MALRESPADATRWAEWCAGPYHNARPSYPDVASAVSLTAEALPSLIRSLQPGPPAHDGASSSPSSRSERWQAAKWASDFGRDQIVSIAQRAVHPLQAIEMDARLRPDAAPIRLNGRQGRQGRQGRLVPVDARSIQALLDPIPECLVEHRPLPGVMRGRRIVLLDRRDAPPTGRFSIRSNTSRALL